MSGSADIFGNAETYGRWYGSSGIWSAGSPYMTLPATVASETADGTATPYLIQFDRTTLEAPFTDGYQVRTNAAGDPYTFNCATSMRLLHWTPAAEDGFARITYGMEMDNLFSVLFVQEEQYVAGPVGPVFSSATSTLTFTFLGSTQVWNSAAIADRLASFEPRFVINVDWSRTERTATLTLTLPDDDPAYLTDERAYTFTLSNVEGTLTPSASYSSWSIRIGHELPGGAIEADDALAYLGRPYLAETVVDATNCGSVDASALPGSTGTVYSVMSSGSATTDLEILVETDCDSCPCGETCGVVVSDFMIRGISVVVCGDTDC